MLSLTPRSIAFSGALLFSFCACYSTRSGAQTLQGRPGVTPPSPLAATAPVSQQQALQSLTSVEINAIQTAVRPRMKTAIQNHQSTAVGTFRSFQDIIHAGTPNSSTHIQFESDAGIQSNALASLRTYYPSATASHALEVATPNLTPRPPIRDQDGDGLPDCCDGLEDQLAYEFRPLYFISSSEQQQFATFANSVPWTVDTLVGTAPPKSYVHVSPLGLATDTAGNQLFAVRIDFLSLWNADGGLIGGGAACFYSYFGLDSVINQVSGHVLDAERSVMLLAAPAVNGSYNPDRNAYKLYSLYTAAHEGTFFDQSIYADFPTPVPAGNHVYLAQSLSKHSTYSFNPDYYPITPSWFIVSTNAAISAAYADGEIDTYTYLALLAAADDTFYGCLVERFGNQGADSISYPVLNVGEVDHPLTGYAFIQDNSSRALGLASKITNPVF